MHPSLAFVLNTLSYSNNADRLFLEYDGYVNKSKILLYNTKCVEKEIDNKKLVEVLSRLLGPTFTVDIATSSIYSMHRRVLFIRLILPDNLLSINYEDEKVNIDVSSTVEEALRKCITVIK